MRLHASGGDHTATGEERENRGLFDRLRARVPRRTFLKTAAATAVVAVGPSTTSAETDRANPIASSRSTKRSEWWATNVNGAMYIPSKDWNAYQMWANYNIEVVERDLDLAASLGLDSLRVLASYECWREDGASFFAQIEHFLSKCYERNIRPVIVLFEAPPKNEPTEENRTTTDPAEAFGVHSPSQRNVIQPRNWSGWAQSPLRFVRRWAEMYASDPRLLATEIMNEPGEVQPRQDFVKDMLAEVREHAPEATLTVGCKDVQYNHVYDEEDALDVHQFHMNLPLDRAAADDYLARAREHRQETGKPLWCTEWQRTREEPSIRFLPNYKSLAPIIGDAHADGSIDGDFFWGLMLKPAYLQSPREDGRVNGLFHPDGTPFDASDRDALARKRRTYPDGWDDHPFPYPSPRRFCRQ